MSDLPLFPLNTVLFPGLPLKLNIFETRYKEMLQRCLKTGEKFGVVLIKKGQEALGPLPDPFLIGCTAQLLQIDQTQDNQYAITAVGRERFRILTLDRTTYSYLSAQAQNLPYLSENDQERILHSRKLRPWVKRYLGILGKASDMQIDPRYLPVDPLGLAFLATYLLQISALEKQKVLEIENGVQLLLHVIQLYRREVSLVDEMLNRERGNNRSPWLN